MLPWQQLLRKHVTMATVTKQIVTMVKTTKAYTLAYDKLVA